MATQGTPTVEQALKYAESAIRNGDLHVGRSALLWVLKRDPRNVKARLWYAYLTEDHKAKVDLYSQVLQIDPHNETAKKALAKYGSPPPTPPPQAPPAVDDETDQGPPTTELEIVSPIEGTEVNVAAKLDIARRDLLDMGMRNKLLNHRPLKSKGVEIIDEKSPEVFRILVTEGRSMSFLPAPEADEDSQAGQAELEFQEAIEELAQPEEPDDKDPSRHTDDKLQTPYKSEALQRRLLSSYHAANTYIQEQGVNILFISLGMLKWYESDSSSEPRQAPLILVPVELSRSNVKAKFRVRYTEQDIVENLSLRAKLETDFEIGLPEFPVDDLDPATYLESIENALDAMERWEVSRDTITLGFFSYGKFLMFNDLQPDEWPEELQPHEHPILNRLLHSGFDDRLEFPDDDIRIDDVISPDDVHHVVDADSSQVLAIHDVNQGRNLVIQGPPGTGKSQTITNLIAEAIGNGKTVLFVAEKMAALEVVKRRLDLLGLGVACLELHSHKTNKRIMLEELKRSLELGRPTSGRVVDITQLKKNQARLNDYCEAVNQEVGESDLTPYEIYGRLMSIGQTLEDIPLPELRVEGLDAWSEREFGEARAICGEMEILLRRMGKPIDHPFWGSTITSYLPADRSKILSALNMAAKSLAKLVEAASQFSELLNLPKIDTSEDAGARAHTAEHLLTMPDMSGVSVHSGDWISDTEPIRAAFDAGIRVRSLRTQYAASLADEAWNADVSSIHGTLLGYKDKFWRWFSPSYREATRELLRLLKIELPKSTKRRLELLEAILRRQELLPALDGFHGQGSALFGERWRGEKSQWDELIDIANWLNSTHQKVASGELETVILDLAALNLDGSTLRQRIDELTDALTEHGERASELISVLKLKEDIRLREAGRVVDLDFAKQGALFGQWREQVDRLQEIVIFSGLAEQLAEKGLTRLVQISVGWLHAADHLSHLLEQSWLSALLQRTVVERPILATFNGELHENSINRFRELDQGLLESNRVLLAIKHWQQLPKHEAGGRLGVLRQEFGRQRRHLPIRKLMTKAGKAIQAIKPVFMMSPLSIAQYLPPGSIEFDLVIFDEASQVKPADAFGAILRGKQLVVVGDDRQLPPTTFFESAIDVDEDYSDGITFDLESILGMCRARGVPHRMLKWHYRSQHESLITVSNSEFYDHKLVIFPSPDKDRTEVGLVYHHLPETRYDRGGSSKNIGEARAVASAVMKHAESTPNLTLGVATFSHNQREAILDQLELMRREEDSTENFFHAHPEEPFFVKSLENVQGDERDVILISVGYGRGSDGRVLLNFGPLNNEGGERRLNVLITRARRRCEVFTNLLPEDIDLERTDSRGIHVLKQFLYYAYTGRLDLPVATDGEPDSPFELAVASELKRRGHRVAHQVGTGGFFIDLALVDSDHPGRYLLGVECDGATYHSARSARDRDRIRQEVLEGMGWQIHRVWSTDWFKDPAREMQKLEVSIARAKQTKSKASADGANPSPGRKPQSTEIKRYNPVARKQPAIRVKPYEVAGISNAAYKSSLHEVSAMRMAEWITRVVQVEGPVHVDEVARRITDSAGVKRLGHRIQAAYGRGLAAAIREGTVKKRGDFLWPRGANTAVLRSRASLPPASRKIDLIAPEEIELAVVEVIKASFGIPIEGVPSEVASLFGIQRTTKTVSSTITRVVRRMLRQGRVVEQGDNLQLAEK